MKLTTTLNRIRKFSPCVTGWKTLNKHLGSDFDADQEINLLTILESNGVQDMLWCLRTTIQDSKKVTSQLAIEFAEISLPVFEERYPEDHRPRRAIQAARDYCNGTISVEDLAAARRDADAAADAADAADADAADAAVHAAYAADAAVHAADAAVHAAYAADDAVHAAYAAVRETQADIIRMILEW